MRYPHTRTTKLFVLFAFISVGVLSTPAQTNQARSLVTAPVNEGQMLEASRQYVIRSPARNLIAASRPIASHGQHAARAEARSRTGRRARRPASRAAGPVVSRTTTSGITPQEFGARFGASDHDIQAVTSWLQSHDFRASKFRPTQRHPFFRHRRASSRRFHTAIHSYVVKGEEHWANSADQQIPAALAGVVAGVGHAAQFRSESRPATRAGTFTLNRDGKVKPLHPLFTLIRCSGDCGNVANNCFALGPHDFATIYNVLPSVECRY